MQHKTTQERPKDTVALQALSMAFGTMTSRVLGLVRDQAFAAMFNRTVTDAWTVAFRLPNMFRRLLGEGSLSVSFIPVFVETKTEDITGVRAQNLVNSFYTVLLILLSSLTALGIINSPWIVRLMTDPAYSMVPGKFELTVRFAQIMFCFIFFMSTYAFFMGILNSFGKFALAAMAPTFFNIAMIISNFVPKNWQTMEGDALAYGVVIGGFLQTIILVPSLVKLGFFPRFKFFTLTAFLKNKDANRVWKNMIPGMLGMGLLQVMTLINTQFASSLGEGTLTYLYLADRLLELPLSLISVSMGTALLPTLSLYCAQNDDKSMISTANYYFRLNLFSAIPAAIGLMFLAQPIVELLYMRSKFTLQDAIMTAEIVRLYGFTLIASSCVRVLVPSFYAIKNTWLPATVSAVCLLAHVFMAPILMARYQVQGLVFSTTLSASLNLILLIFSHYWIIGKFGLTKIFYSLIKITVPATALSLAIQLYQPLLRLLGEGRIAKFISLFGIIGFGILVYAVFSYWIKVEEFKGPANRILSRLSPHLVNMISNKNK